MQKTHPSERLGSPQKSAGLVPQNSYAETTRLLHGIENTGPRSEH